MFGTTTVHVIIFEFVSVALAPLFLIFAVPFSFLDHLKADNLAVSDKSENLSENGILTVNFLSSSIFNGSSQEIRIPGKWYWFFQEKYK